MLVSPLKKNWHYVIGFFVLAFILLKVDLAEVLSIMARVNPVYFFLSTLLSLPVFFVKSVRWKYLSGRQKIRYGMRAATSMYFSSLFLGFVTPGRVAEFAKIAYLRRDGYPAGRAFFVTLIDRLFDLMVMAVIVVMCAAVFHVTPIGVALAGALIALIAASLLILRLKTLGSYLDSRLRGILNGTLKRSLEEFLKSARSFGLVDFVSAAILTFVSLSVYYLQAHLLALSMGLDVEWGYLVFAVSLAAMATILPVTLLGVGTRDAMLVLMFAHAGIGKEAAIAYSLLALANIIIFAGFCSLFWFRNPVPLAGNRNVKRRR